jgi:hypothetical protein
MLENILQSTRRVETRSIIQIAAILAIVAVLAVGLYSVAREAGRLLQLSRGATAAGATLVQESAPDLRRTL